MTRKQRRIEEDRQAAEWQRRALQAATADGTAALAAEQAATSLQDAPDRPESRFGLRGSRERENGRYGDTGAVMLEFALVFPLAVLLSITGLFYGLGVLDSMRLERAATEAVHAPQDTATHLVAQAGGVLVCYWAGDGEGGCFPDDLDGLPRIQVVAEGVKSYQPPLGSRITPTASAVALSE